MGADGQVYRNRRACGVVGDGHGEGPDAGGGRADREPAVVRVDGDAVRGIGGVVGQAVPVGVGAVQFDLQRAELVGGEVRYDGQGRCVVVRVGPDVGVPAEGGDCAGRHRLFE